MITGGIIVCLQTLKNLIVSFLISVYKSVIFRNLNYKNYFFKYFINRASTLFCFSLIDFTFIFSLSNNSNNSFKFTVFFTVISIFFSSISFKKYFSLNSFEALENFSSKSKI